MLYLFIRTSRRRSPRSGSPFYHINSSMTFILNFTRSSQALRISTYTVKEFRCCSKKSLWFHLVDPSRGVHIDTCDRRPPLPTDRSTTFLATDSFPVEIFLVSLFSFRLRPFVDFSDWIIALDCYNNIRVAWGPTSWLGQTQSSWCYNVYRIYVSFKKSLLWTIASRVFRLLIAAHGTIDHSYSPALRLVI